MTPLRSNRAAFTAWVGGLAVLLSAGGTARADLNIKIGDPMPSFSLPRADGGSGEFSLTQLIGRPSIVVFWRPNQTLSLDALRDIKTLSEEIGADRVGIVAVDASSSTAQDVTAALAGATFPFPVLLDPQRRLYGKIGVIVCPTTLLLDGEGVLRFKIASHPRQFGNVLRARIRFLVGDLDEAGMKREIEPTALKIDQDLAAAWRMFNLGRRLQSQGKSDQAVAVFEQAVTQYPSLPEARCTLGFIKLASGDLATAAEHFQTALNHHPGSATARLGQAAVLARTNHGQQAEEMLLALLGRESIAVRVRYELGRIYHARGEIDRAVTFYEDALSGVYPEASRPNAGASAATGGASAPVPSAAGDPNASPPNAKTADDPGSIPTPVAANRTAPATAIVPITPPPDARFIGVKRCKKCHLQQWTSWKDTKMAKALEVLKPGQATDVKARSNLDPRTDFSTDAACLACHTNGFGLPGGYRIPPPGDARATRAASANAGIGCESCHGPGGKYEAIHKDIQDNQRKYTSAELHEAGQYQVDARVCAACHDEKAPCIAPGYVFDFEQRKDEGTHKHHDLRFRAE